MTTTNYDSFVQSKLGASACAGIDAPLRDYQIFPHQRDLTAWALRRGRAAIFADTGLGKSRMQLAWADMVCRETGGDERHICPLQLEVIRRGIDLWTNPGEIVLSPFAGIGSEGYVALQMGRRFVGVELKASYYRQAARNLAMAMRGTADLFSVPLVVP